jgi:iduronate 2-sulfatase
MRRTIRKDSSPYLAGVLFLIVMLFRCGAGPVAPNVLIVLADDLRPELGCYDSDHVVSPNLDRLAQLGVVFNRAYCQKALCWPSRNSFFSGLRPGSLGKANASTTFRDAHPAIDSLPQWFKKNGWHTRGFGKVLQNGQDDPESWSEPAFVPAPLHYASPGDEKKHPIINRSDPANRVNPLYEGPPVADEAYEDGLTATEAVRSLRKVVQSDKPFFFMVGFHKPHTPFNAPARYWRRYDREKISLAENPYPPAEVPDRYAMLDWPYVRSFQGVPESGPMPDQIARAARHGYLACTSYVDALTGRLLSELTRLGVRERTIVLFWSDHGYQLGEHGLWSKHTNFELATRVPLIISAPGGSIRARTDALVELVDIYPTLCDMAGLPKPGHLHGRSFAEILSEPSRAFRSEALSEYSRGGADGFSIRTATHRYTEWTDRKSGKIVARELYEHRKDPDENWNVANQSANNSLIIKLSQRVAERRRNYEKTNE